ncbi:hypothetical protein M426DRAFT_15492 [Hypoxylon sp. CI-4A]|nr:hypothetical protein M426DRAFT_15492 [Hypoxylon sp. CI-4A]
MASFFGNQDVNSDVNRAVNRLQERLKLLEDRFDMTTLLLDNHTSHVGEQLEHDLPPVPIPQDVMEMPFSHVLETFPWMSKLIQLHLHIYNPAYLHGPTKSFGVPEDNDEKGPQRSAEGSSNVFKPSFEYSASRPLDEEQERLRSRPDCPSVNGSIDSFLPPSYHPGSTGHGQPQRFERPDGNLLWDCKSFQSWKHS